MTIIKRSNLNRPLTWVELDNNFEEVQELVESAASAVSISQAQAGYASTSADAASNASAQAAASAQTAQSAVTSTVRAPTGETLNTLPVLNSRKSTLLGFDTNGQPVASAVASFVRTGDDSKIDPSYIPDSVKNSVLAAQLAASGGSLLVGFVQPQSGAVTQTVYSHIRLIRFASDYGATGDGTTNDAPALQNALNASAGGELIITSGVYLINAMLQIPSNTVVRIEAGATILRGDSTMTGMFINKADGTTGGYTANTNITICGKGIIDGNASYAANSCTLIGFGHATNVVVEGITLKNAGGRWHAVELNAVSKGRVSNVTIINNGLPADDLGEAIQIDAMQYAGKFPWFGPYDNTPCNDILIEYNDISGFGCCVGGHDPSSSTMKHTNIRILKNTLAFNTTGIKTQGWSGVKIMHNRIYCANPDTITPVAGILCEYNTTGIPHSDIQICSNTIFNIVPTNTNQDPGENWRGIYVKGNDADTTMLTDIIISDNAIKDCLGHCVVVGGAQQVNVTNNNIAYSRGMASTNFKNSIYHYNSYRVNICNNNCKSPIVLAGGSLTNQTGICTGNYTEQSLVRNANYTKGVVADNYAVVAVPTATSSTGLFVGNNVTG